MKTVCIIPAYNEERTIGDVINTVKKVGLVDKIIVINDGSTDNTAQIARNMGVGIIEHIENMGKGAALKAGIENSSEDVFLFLDADLIGLNQHHVEDLLSPVLSGEADMTVGVFHNGRLLTDLAQRVSPQLSGQRAVTKKVLCNMDDFSKCRYGVEVAISKAAKQRHYRIKTVKLKDMTHIMKEEKYGLRRGITERMKMYWQIVKTLKM